MEFKLRLSQTAQSVETLLDKIISNTPRPHELERPEKLLKATHYGALNGGKRLRPFLVIETAKMFGGNAQAALYAGTALECIHSYSLVHDDLPAMDDDDLRRGKPTVHKAFDEATAILVGDGLLTMAFDILTSDDFTLDNKIRLALISKMAQSAGIGGMVGGQALDLAAEHNTPDENGIVQLQRMKTGALITYACEAGAMIGAASADELNLIRRYGKSIGQAFQLADDILDVTSDVKTMGKNTGKDAARGKGTLIGLHGLEWGRARLDELISDATFALKQLNYNGQVLEQTASFIAKRSN